MATFRVTSQPGVPIEEVSVVEATKSSTGRGQLCGLTSLDRCPQDIFTAIQLQPVFAQWIQNTNALVLWLNDLQAPVRSV